MVNTGRIWVTGTTCLIGFIAYSPQLIGLFGAISRRQSIIFNTLVALILYNYYRAVRTNPGTVPKDWLPKITRVESEHVPSQLKNSTSSVTASGSTRTSATATEKEDLANARYCKKCEAFKPPRAHHCRYCKRCTLRFDHHCPWIDNCVGFHNYVHFIRFLFFVDVSCAMHLYLLTFSAFSYEAYWSRRDDPTPIELTFLVMNYVACIPVLVAVGLFSLYHFWNLACNTTTLEGSEIERARKMVRKGKIRREQSIFPFGLGVPQNIKSILGTTPLEWLFTGKPRGDGLSYPSASGTDPLQWPPRDPYDDLKRTWEREARSSRHRIHTYRYPPYHPAYSALDAQDEEDETRLADIIEGRGDSWSSREVDGWVDYSSGSSDSDEQHDLHEYDQGQEQASDDDDEDVPLAHVQARRRAVRLRRGSEGFEIRPRDEW